ncbi:hypothetical protein EAI_15043 [Harpegnathos saltator]|uniref:Uncharacterized protein n=1 Tax=Harpegnathos saltator TaxID=610380 RepID=E2BZ04_HARSA|nr:hypothetical protein EAI_15043 [Harpegnathos saltator]
MFAILKFQQRTDAAAFSHAFVLTIKISEEQPLFDLKYPIVKEANASAAFENINNITGMDEKATETVTHATDKMPPRRTRIYSDKRINLMFKHNQNALNDASEASTNSTLRDNITEKAINFCERSNRKVKSTTTTEEGLTDKCSTETDIDEKATKSVTHTTDKMPSRRTRFYSDKRISQMCKQNQNALNNALQTPTNSTLQDNITEKSTNFCERSNGRVKSMITTEEDFTNKCSTEIDIDEKATKSVTHTTDKMPPRRTRFYSDKRISQMCKQNQNALNNALQTPTNSTLQDNITEKSTNFCERSNGRVKSTTTTEEDFTDKRSIETDINERAAKSVTHSTDKMPPRKTRIYADKRISQMFKQNQNALNNALQTPTNSTLQDNITEKSTNFCERSNGRVKSTTTTEEDFTDKRSIETDINERAAKSVTHSTDKMPPRKTRIYADKRISQMFKQNQNALNNALQTPTNSTLQDNITEKSTNFCERSNGRVKSTTTTEEDFTDKRSIETDINERAAKSVTHSTDKMPPRKTRIYADKRISQMFKQNQNALNNALQTPTNSTLQDNITEKSTNFCERSNGRVKSMITTEEDFTNKCSTEIDIDEKATKSVTHTTDKMPPRRTRFYSDKRISQMCKQNQNALNNALQTPTNSTLQDNITEKSTNFCERSNGRVKSTTTTEEDFTDKRSIETDINERAAKSVTHSTDKMPPRKTRIYADKRISQMFKQNQNALNNASETPTDSALQDNITEKSDNFCERLNERIKSTTTTEEGLIDQHSTESDIDEKIAKSMTHTTDKMPLRKRTRTYADKRISLMFKQNQNASNDASKFRDSICVDKLRNSSSRKSEKDIVHENAQENAVAHRRDQSRTAKKKNVIQVERTDGTNEDTKRVEMQKGQVAQKMQKHQVFPPAKPSFPTTVITKNDVELLNKRNSNEDSMRKERVDKNNSADETNKSIVDSRRASHRYCTQKNTDNTKPDRLNARSTTSSPVSNEWMQKSSQRGTSEAKNSNENFASTVETEKVNEESTRKQQRSEAADESSDKRCSTSTRPVNDRVQNSTHNKSHNRARKQRSREREKKISVLDEKVLRSSNITDLVMEGLMFTIRQDEDSMAVIEQKTKLEVDEVLENSEKVETEAGEKCLLNSSLLRLENLITMIEPPRDKDEQHKINHNMIGNSSYSSALNVGNVAYHLDDVDYINRTTGKLGIPNYERQNTVDQSKSRGFCWQQQRAYSNVASNDSYSTTTSRNATERNEQSMEWEDGSRKEDEECTQHYDDVELINEEEGKERKNIGDEKEVQDVEIQNEEDEEEDIVPEVFRSTVFPVDKNADPLDTDLLMDDMNVEETGKSTTFMKKHDVSPPQFRLPSDSNEMSASGTVKTSKKKPKSSKWETNVPRVISNTAITVEEIPLALQKILRHTRKFPPAPTAKETSSAAHDDKEETQDTTSADNTAFAIGAPSDQVSLLQSHWQQQQQIHSDIANNDNYLASKNAMENEEQLMEWEVDVCKLDEENIHQNLSSEKNCDLDVDTKDEFIEVVDNSDDEETKNKDQDIKIDVEDTTDYNGGMGSRKRKTQETHSTSQVTTLSEMRTRHSSSRKLQDITEDFYHDLHVHNKNNATQQRCLRQRLRSLNSPEDIKTGNVRIEMLKFIQDMTEGAKVVLRRLNIDKKSSLS